MRDSENRRFPEQIGRMLDDLQQRQQSTDPEAGKTITAVKVDRYDGQSINLPQGMDPLQGAFVLMRHYADQETETTVTESIPVFPFDGALALSKAVERMFGFTEQKVNLYTGTTQQIAVEVGIGQTVSVPWGKIALPGIEGEVETDVNLRDGRWIFELSATVKKKYVPTVHELIALTRQIIAEESIFRGKAIQIRFTDHNGYTIKLPQPRFIPVDNAFKPIFDPELESAIQTTVITPIKMHTVMAELGMDIKRGALLAGPYGTGKTALAHYAAKMATENGWTFLYLEDAEDLPKGLMWALGYQPCVVYAEDFDRVAEDEGEETTDEIANTLDGLLTKHSQVMVLLTTNYAERVTTQMLRPGRLDVILEIHPPKLPSTVEAIIRSYAGNQLDPKEDLTEVTGMLVNKTPAQIHEVVARSKLAAIGRTGTAEYAITAGDLAIAARLVLAQERFMHTRANRPDFKEAVERAAGAFGKEAVQTYVEHIFTKNGSGE